MKKFLKKVITCVSIVGVISAMSGSEMIVSNVPINPESSYSENQSKENAESIRDFLIDVNTDIKQETSDGKENEAEIQDSYETNSNSGKENEAEIQDSYETNSNSGKENDAEVQDPYATYSKTEYVQVLRKAIGAGSDYSVFGFDWYKYDNVTRFEHKNGKPITIACAPTVSQKTQELAKESVAELLDIIKNVNDLYDYEFIEYDENNPADITINNRFLAANGYAEFNESNRMGYEDHYISRATIHINEDAHFRAYSQAEVYTQIKYTLKHEAMHILGYHDVYETETSERDSTTYLSTANLSRNKYASENITPNDFRNIIACYYKPSGDIEKDIENCKKIAEEYTKEYYTSWLVSHFEDRQIPTKNIENGTYSFVRNVYIDKENLIRDEFTFNLTIKDKEWKLVVVDSNGRERENCFGDIRYANLDNSGQKLTKAVAIMEGMKSFYISSDILNSTSIATSGVLNGILYESDGKMVFVDALGSINSAYPQFKSQQFEEQQPQM